MFDSSAALTFRRDHSVWNACIVINIRHEREAGVWMNDEIQESPTSRLQPWTHQLQHFDVHACLSNISKEMASYDPLSFISVLALNSRDFHVGCSRRSCAEIRGLGEASTLSIYDP